MAVVSSLRRGVLTTKNVVQTQVRNGGYSAAIRPSRWTYDKFKDDLHFYFMLGAIPCGLGVLVANIMGGNTELRAIPEDYTPKEWEHFRNPITRFIVKHFKVGYQELYEVSLHNNWETSKVVEMKQLKAEVKRQMALQGDYKGWYHRSDLAKFARQRQAMIDRKSTRLNSSH